MKNKDSLFIFAILFILCFFFEVIKLCNVASTKFETIYLKNKYILKIFSYIFSHFAFLDQKNPKSLTKFYGQKIQMIMRYSLHLVNKYRGTGFFHRHCYNLTDFPLTRFFLSIRSIPLDKYLLTYLVI